MGRMPCGAGRYRAEAGKLPGHASRGCAVADATLKQSSCGVILVARPTAAPGRSGNRLWRSWKFLEVHEAGNFPSFPMLRSSFPNPAGRRPCAVMRQRAKRSFSPTIHGGARGAKRISPPVSNIRRGSAPPPSAPPPLCVEIPHKLATFPYNTSR